MYGSETYFMKPDGTRLPAVINCSLLRDEEGKPLSIICSTVDITELQKRETELKESNEFNRLLVENLPATIVIFDEESRISSVNKEFVRLSGWKRRDYRKMAANVPYSKPPLRL
jgi:PAS domain S-box